MRILVFSRVIQRLFASLPSPTRMIYNQGNPVDTHLTVIHTCTYAANTIMWTPSSNSKASSFILFYFRNSRYIHRYCKKCHWMLAFPCLYEEHTCDVGEGALQHLKLSLRIEYKASFLRIPILLLDLFYCYHLLPIACLFLLSHYLFLLYFQVFLLRRKRWFAFGWM